MATMMNEHTDNPGAPVLSRGSSVDANQLWQTVLNDLEGRISRNAFDNWLRQTSLAGMDGDVAIVTAPNPFTVSTLESRYKTQVERALSSILGRAATVEFAVAARPDTEGDGQPRTSKSKPAAQRSRPASSSRPRAKKDQAEANPSNLRNQQTNLQASSNGLNPRLTFATYVVGGSNRFAHAASQAVAEQPGGKFNPLFVHGGVGLGKTHLLHAIGHKASEIDPDLKIVYVSSETFTNDVINAIRAQKMEDFRSRYRTIDILMIDDIQFIAGKESTQEEFFHTFNALYQSGKQIVISSDKPPKAIAALEARMLSRFEGGLIADVQAPDYEMRTAILRTKAEEIDVTLPHDVIEYIAAKDQSNTRELEGALNKILMMAQLYRRELTLQLAMEALTDTSTADRRAQTNADDVVNAVCEHFSVKRADLQGRGRQREIVLPRQIAMYLLREETHESLVDIGKALGGRDHTTVLHGIEKIEAALESNTQLRGQLMTIREKLLTGSTS